LQPAGLSNRLPAMRTKPNIVIRLAEGFDLPNAGPQNTSPFSPGLAGILTSGRVHLQRGAA
jgi:hypothetical protein